MCVRMQLLVQLQIWQYKMIIFAIVLTIVFPHTCYKKTNLYTITRMIILYSQPNNRFLRHSTMGDPWRKTSVYFQHGRLLKMLDRRNTTTGLQMLFNWATILCLPLPPPPRETDTCDMASVVQPIHYNYNLLFLNTMIVHIFFSTKMDISEGLLFLGFLFSSKLNLLQ